MNKGILKGNLGKRLSPGKEVVPASREFANSYTDCSVQMAIDMCDFFSRTRRQANFKPVILLGTGLLSNRVEVVRMNGVIKQFQFTTLTYQMGGQVLRSCNQHFSVGMALLFHYTETGYLDGIHSNGKADHYLQVMIGCTYYFQLNHRDELNKRTRSSFCRQQLF